MTARESLDRVLNELPDAAVGEVLDFAHFLASRREIRDWSRFGVQQLSSCYGLDEPEYTEADLKLDIDS